MIFIRFFLKIGMLLLLFPLRVFKIKNNRILLLNNILNFDATYSCHPKYISEYLLNNYPNVFEIIYPLGKNRKNEEEILKKKGIKTVKLGSLKYYYYALTSKFFVTTSGAISYIPFSKKQVVINTWHGGGAYKKMGLDHNNNFFYRLDCKLTESKTTFFMSSNKYFSEVVGRSLLIPKSKILEIGMPRNDIFFSNYEDIIKKVKNKFNIESSTKIVLYAPTYRTMEGNQFLKHKLGPYEIDTDAIINSLEKKFGGKWIFGLRFHPSISKNIEGISKDMINMSFYDDPQELLCAADILINDYSSIMWDFAQTYKPCFIFAKDLEEYENSAGLYTKPSSWPFLLAKDNKELMQKIEDFDKNKYVEDVKKYFYWMGSFETGNASKKLCEKIFEIYKNSEDIK